ncbi:type II toxin-antitoxin system RelB/DinJ family antitoxin [Ochrobactrum quorumnocens]|jgi:DNA-damage-inducible protein J|uniref:Addiction module antitoxin, RelB/DinJ family protein n=1 Tax=Ochrobactrum quorumnocens TaxID=271865 RepID=A0A248UC77_9HYPH|nr:type II toxin-antitoxin system RelB/DinJ family antitoxin [[Ochrobactrum] quorumnocens]ASV84413.1 addiction module antitoxin, RelB/DinJ family protein [[Ochrobactrum] quorumnocens]KAA9371101.1 type II toxin-antitoxin system RelB/DinJ family antitoxin [[Ochrobactrum] quorumnocens]MBD7989597.1 type II toxin-antitoxin system RelB/DinJ family antitoxin [Ochrobactrum gallinarum]PRA80977.1 type II toxin-antitoxin system antitoxin, RelB/DinJ family [Ochrobactrum sp. MYb29]
MAANQLVQTRIDGEVKAQAAAVLATMGLTVSDAVRLMLTKVAKEKTLPFEIWQPNAETIAAMEEARSGSLKAMSLNEAKAEMRAIINADD